MGTVSFKEAYDLAAEHFGAGRLREAEHVLIRILTTVKDQPDCLHMLGLAQHQLKRGTAGVELIRRAIDLNPTNSLFRANLAALLNQFGHDDVAMAEVNRGIELDPNLPEAHNIRGCIFRDRRNQREAIESFRKAIALQPSYPDALNNLAGALVDVNRPDEAVPLLTRALELRPNWPEALNSLGNALQLQSRFQEALNAYRKAITLKPRYLEAHTNLGHAMRAQNRLEEAMHAYRAALAIDAQSPEPVWATGFISLLHGDFKPGFEGLEARLFHRDKLATFAQPNWNGEDLKGKRIMLVAEQGLGDTIQFVRYAPMIKSLGAQVAVLCQVELERLLKTCAGIDLVVPDGTSTPTVEFRCPMMSIPRVLGTTPQTIPAQVPYLFADERLSKAWGERLASTHGMRVGVSWTGDPRHKNNINRSMPREMPAALSQIPGVTLFSLQKGAEPAPGMINWTKDFSDLADTAAFIANLDLVISVDTAVCHLAGAMGKPVWTLIPFAPDWRWMLDRPDSPWYPTMRLYRQPSIGDWGTPMMRVFSDLKQLAGQRTNQMTPSHGMRPPRDH